MSHCQIHGWDVHERGDCPILGDVQASIEHALGWRTVFIYPEQVAQAARLATDAALDEYRDKLRRDAEFSAEAKVRRQYEDAAYAGSQAEKRAEREIGKALKDAERAVEEARSDMRDRLTGFVQALVDHHLPHEAVEQAAERVAGEDGYDYIGRDAFALDMADKMVREPTR